MKRCLSLALLVTLVVWASAAPDPQPVTIKIKETAQGDVRLIESSEGEDMTFKVVDEKGKVLLSDTKKKSRSDAYTETIRQREGKKNTKLERDYTKAEKQEDDKKFILGLVGKTVVVEKNGEKYVFALKDGEKLKEAAAEALTKEFATKRDENEVEKLLLPKTPVKPGDSWEVDLKTFIKEFGSDGEMEFDLAKSIGSGKLLKVYTQDGKQFGEMQIKLELAVTMIGKGKDRMKAGAGSKVSLNIALDNCIDGNSEAGTFSARVDVSLNWPYPDIAGTTAILTTTVESKTITKDPPKK
jgi:hypothetical protein